MYGVSDDDLKKKLLEKGNTLTRIQALSIGKAHETTNQDVQECCRKPPVSDNSNAVFKDKSNKGLTCNYCANKKGSHSFANKRHCPAWGAVSDICRLQTADCRLQTADCRLQTTDYRLCCGPQTVDYKRR